MEIKNGNNWKYKKISAFVNMHDGTLDMCIPAHKVNVSVERSQNSQGGGGGHWFLNKIQRVPPYPPVCANMAKWALKSHETGKPKLY